MKKIYIAGAITGVKGAKAIFDKAKLELEKLGYIAISPFDNGLEESCTWEQHMIADAKMLRQCDAIYLLSNWNNSIGANIEYLLAAKWKLEIIYQ